MIENGDFPVLQVTEKWLDDYFCRKKTSVFTLLLVPGKTGFRQAVRNILCGEVMGTMKSPENGRSDRDATHVQPGGSAAQAITRFPSLSPVIVRRLQ